MEIPRQWYMIGAGYAFLAVALGAFGAHALKDVLDEHGRNIYKTAVLYHMFHSLALLITGLTQRQWPQLNLSVSGWSFSVGILIFSGSLYMLAITKITWLGAITPIGGIAFLTGWLWLLIQFIRNK